MNKLNKIFLLIIILLVITLIVSVSYYRKKAIDFESLSISNRADTIKLKQQLEDIETSYNRDTANIDMQINPDSITPNGITLVITDTNNIKYEWNENYKLSRKENGNLVELTPISDVKFNQDNFVFNENNQYEQHIDWTSIYGTLPKGTYILDKDISTYTKTLWCSSNEFQIK